MAEFTEFLCDDAGAVTIDWVALTSAILLLGIMVVYAIFNGGVSSLVASINNTLTTVNTNVDVGQAPNLNGGDVGGPMLMADGISVPVGSTVVSSNGSRIAFETPDGDNIHTHSGNGSPLPVGSTVTSANSLKLPGGSTASFSDFFNS